jgi:rhamnose utilization protein RhaD (predicted bifunctional aldolase and dehydrogenase)
LEFVNSHDCSRLAEIGTSCPDHFLRTKIKPLYVEWDPQAQAAYLLASGKLPDTTGQILNVDGGLLEAFLR